MSDEPTYHRLPSGATVVVLPLPWAQTVALGAWLRSGTRDEPAELNGIAHFLEHMVFKGSLTRDTLELARAFETLGGTMDAYTTHEATVYSLQVLPEHVDAGCELLADLIVDAAIEDESVVTEKEVVAEEIRESDDSPADIVQEVCARQAWGQHPLSRPVLGTLATVGGITRESVTAWRDRQYTGERLLLAAAGAVEPQRVIEAAERWFAKLPASGDPPAEAPPVFTPGIAAKREPSDQVHLCLCAPAPGASSPDRHALWVIDMLLGSTMSSRLFQEVRERRGLAYQVSSSWQTQRDVGLLAIDAIASPGKVAELLEVTRGEAAKMASDGINEVDLDWVKNYARTTLRLGAESTSAQMARLARGYFYDGRHVPLEETLNAIEALTRDDILRVAQAVMGGDQWVLAVAGPVTDKRAERWWKAVTR